LDDVEAELVAALRLCAEIFATFEG